VEKIFHPFQPFIMGQMYFPPKIAAKLGIPLVFYGENPTEYGNPIKDDDQSQKEWDYFTSADPSEIYLAGVSIRELVEDFGLEKVDIEPYMPPDPASLSAAEIAIHYLGYYLRWHPQSNYYYAVENGGFEAAPERSTGTYSKYSSIDDRIDDFHYYATFIKFGIGRATYDAAQEARSDDIDRDEAVALVKRYDGEYPERFAEQIFDYLSLPPDQFPLASKMFEQPIIDRAYFDALTDTFRSPNIWCHDAGGWRLRRAVWEAN